MTRYTKLGRRTHFEATPFAAVPDAAQKREREPLPSQAEAEDAALGVKRLKRSEQRRQRRQSQREHGKVCYNCREEGHRAERCPKLSNSVGLASVDGPQPGQICYRCGKTDHSLKQCRQAPSKGLPFARCFVCNNVGHISAACPANSRGIYPEGGSCKICRQVDHLAKDCPLPEEVRLGQVVGTHSQRTDRKLGADDDDFHDIVRVQKPDKQVLKSGVSRPPARDVRAARTAPKTVSF
ncbi:Zinc finger CCHC domain-containing protein 9 [Savitreella phatthalungensis]